MGTNIRRDRSWRPRPRPRSRRGGPGRVAHVTTVHPAGDNRIFRKECAALAEAGMDVHLVAVSDADRSEDGVHIWSLPRRPGRWRRTLLGPVDAWRVLRKLQPDLIHVHDPELVPLAVFWSWVNRRPGVYDAHEDLSKAIMGMPRFPLRLRPLVSRMAKVVDRLADRYLATVVAATPSIARNYRRVPVTLVQNFPWLRDFPEPGLPQAVRTAAYIGGICGIRGIGEMARAGDLDPPFDIIVAGLVDGAESQATIDSSKAIEYRGLLPASHMTGLLAEAVVGLVLLHPVPNYLESQPTKLFEYMAAGRPFVASDFATWRDLLGRFECGLFVDPLDPSAIHKAVDSLLSDIDLAREMGERGRRAFVEGFSFEAEADKLVAMTIGLLQ